jgi:hypothetical protein
LDLRGLTGQCSRENNVPKNIMKRKVKENEHGRKKLNRDIKEEKMKETGI